jgi:peptidoglycan/xylan/chitin deacetylase (PgdA/CDA1 family)
MESLAGEGWRALPLDEFASSTPPAPRTFLLTFDDGYASLAEYAYPLLEALGFTATTFLITDFVGRTNTWDMRYTWSPIPHLDWKTVEHWQGRGFDFASHSATHRRLTWLTDGPALGELHRSREALIARLGPQAGRAVAYPFGAVDDRLVRFAGKAGYELGFGGVHGNGDRLHLPRVPVYAWDRGDVPFGLRDDRVGAVGKLVAHLANRCAVGTSLLTKLRRKTSPQPE